MKSILIIISSAIAISAFVFSQPATGQSAVEQQLMALEREKDKANLQADKGAFDRLYADDFAGIDASGGSTSKEQIIKYYASGGSIVESATSDEIAVRVFGDTAIVSGRFSYKFT